MEGAYNISPQQMEYQVKDRMLAAFIGFWRAGAVELTPRREWVITTLFTLLGIIIYLSTFQPK